MKRLLLILYSFLILIPARASHLMGGEITWECLGTGEFVFTMKIYRDCNGVSGPSFASLAVWNCPGVTSIPLNKIAQNDISPVCNAAGPAITCAGATGTTDGAVEEFVFESNPIMLPGVPPANGWIFSWSSCCRNAAIVNLSIPSAGFTLRAIMYPYNASNTSPCYDSSPVFAERPSTIICTGYPFTFSHNAWDKDLDSLVYTWDQPLEEIYTGPWSGSNPSPIPFSSGYSMTSPLPGVTQNANNVPAVLNPSTGEISYTSYTSGAYVTVIKVAAYKCGQKVAEVFREIQVVLLSCGTNTPPDVTPPFKDPLTGLYTSYADTVYAGDLVNFTLSATDFEYLQNGNPQYCFLSASGSEFGTGYVNTASGCLNPPCATLSPPPGDSAQFGIATTFNWQTDCNHLGYSTQCLTFSNTYTFVIKIFDDYCPAPGLNFSNISITILPPPVLDAPDLRCVSVLPNGDVSLSWIVPPDTSARFRSYYVYEASGAAGPFTKIDSISNYNQTSYTHVGAGANTAPKYYYMTTRSTCLWQVSGSSDTLKSMKLDVTNPNNGMADLSWNAIHSPNLPSSSGWYRIYKEYPPGTWSLVDSTQAITYSDPVTLCNDSVNYRVEIQDASGCVSVSSVDGDKFQDILAPATPVIDSVSVEAVTGNVVIGWEPDTCPDTKCYIVYQFVNGIWDSIANVCGINNTAYNTGMAAACVDSFRVVAYDSCGNTSIFGSPHNTICLTVALKSCESQAVLGWNEYINWPGGVLAYNIYASENGGIPFLLASNNGTTTGYIHTPLNQFSTYCYIVQAVDTSGRKTSSSNQVCIFANVPNPPKFLYTMTATVSGTHQARVDFYADTAGDVIYYNILRSASQGGPYEKIGVAPGTSSPYFSYYDYTAETDVRSYYYKAVAIDSCGTEVFTSNLGRTIYLEGEPNGDYTNTLKWNDYEDWSGEVKCYNLYRSVDDVWQPAPVDIVPFGNNTFLDDTISDYADKEGKFCYLVQAFEDTGNVYGFADTSLSNIACIIQGPRLYSPNAFTPDGKNPKFYPLSVFIDASTYSFIIYDRWGRLLFETEDSSLGWDGTFKGEPMPEGVYAYIVKFTGTNGKKIERKGTVTLIR